MSTRSAGWLGSYGGEDSPDDISRGLFSGEVGSLRLLRLFERFGIKTTWFIPGHSIETFPEQMQAVASAGHEIGVHGYSHENPIAMTPAQEEEVLDRCIDLVTQLAGKRPTGYVAPWWEFSNVTNELLLKKGIKYDHSLMHNDFHPYRVRVGDSWTKIDYGKTPSEWMVPLRRGHETELIEIPASWYLDDLPPMMFIKKAPNSHGFVNPRDIEQIWRDQFDWVYREMDYAVFPITIHPDRVRPAAGPLDAGAPLPASEQPRGRALRHHGRDGRRLCPALSARRRLTREPFSMCSVCGTMGGAGALDVRRRAVGCGRHRHPPRRARCTACASRTGSCGSSRFGSRTGRAARSFSPVPPGGARWSMRCRPFGTWRGGCSAARSTRSIRHCWSAWLDHDGTDRGQPNVG